MLDKSLILSIYYNYITYYSNNYIDKTNSSNYDEILRHKSGWCMILDTKNALFGVFGAFFSF
jgi:hypothetical protein